MTRRTLAIQRLESSRQRLRVSLAADAGIGAPGALLGHLVRRHPWASAAAAVALGALLVRLRPWRWALKTELWSALVPGLLARLVAAPPGTWSVLLAAFVQELAAAAAPAEASVPGSAPV